MEEFNLKNMLIKCLEEDIQQRIILNNDYVV